ncbi:MAG TPA: NAD(P)/FAD-dependent oxidoreductase, partial [Solirubrobacteraceae bacterium]
RVVIIGGGFGGIAAAKRLKRAAVDVTLIDRTNHQLFQPLLYQVATGALSSGQCAAPIRGILKRQHNASVVMAEVTGIDVDRREVVLDRGERLNYDHLIVACGGQTSYFGHDDWQDASYPLKTLADAVSLRNRIFGAFEEAERAPAPASRHGWLTFVVVGGGPTGVEVSGQLAVLVRHALKREFSRIDPRATRVILLDAGQRVVPTFSQSTSAKAAKALDQLGVHIREGARVVAVEADGVTVKVGDDTERLAARTVIWAAGVRTAAIAGIVASATGAATDGAGRVEVNSDLTLPGHREISVIGDAASLAGEDGRPLPGLATTAIQQAQHVADAIRHGQPDAAAPFQYFDKGALAVIGRGRAVGEVRGHKLSGLLAFLMYLGIHLYYLGGVGGRRLTVLATWISTGFGALQSQVIDRELQTIERASETAAPRLTGLDGSTGEVAPARSIGHS